MSNYTDLVSVTSIFENDKISSLVLGDAWIGLHRKPWAWSDSSTSNFTNWHGIVSSNIVSMRSCVMASTMTGLWWEEDCGEEHYALCEDLFYSGDLSNGNSSTIKNKAKTATTTYKLKFKSQEDLNSPAVQEQLLVQVQYI